MAARELLCRTERAVSFVKLLAVRFAALEATLVEATAARASTESRLAAIEAAFHELQTRTDTLETAFPAAPGRAAEASGSRFEEHARAIQQLQDRIIRLERSNRELSVRLEQLRGLPAAMGTLRATA